MKKLNSIPLIALLLGACSNSPIRFSDAEPVPESRIYAYQETNKSYLRVTRDQGLLAAGCNISLFINGKRSADFAQGEGASFQIPAGQLIVGVTPSANCGGGEFIERKITSLPGEVIRRRIFVSPTRIDLLPTLIDY